MTGGEDPSRGDGCLLLTATSGSVRLPKGDRVSHVCGEPQLPVSLGELGKPVTRVEVQAQCCLEERVQESLSKWCLHGKENVFSTRRFISECEGGEQSMHQRNVVHRLGVS